MKRSKSGAQKRKEAATARDAVAKLPKMTDFFKITEQSRPGTSTERDEENYGVVVRASASQSVDLGFIPLVESYQKTLKNGIYSFPAWRSAFMGGCGEQADKFACCVLGQGT